MYFICIVKEKKEESIYGYVPYKNVLYRIYNQMLRNINQSKFTNIHYLILFIIDMKKNRINFYLLVLINFYLKILIFSSIEQRVHNKLIFKAFNSYKH